LFEKILVAVDGSEHSGKALKFAAEMTKIHKSRKLALINVYSVTVPAYGFPEQGGLGVNAEMYQGMLDSAQVNSAEILANGKNIAIAQGVPAEIIESLSIEGHNVETIVRTAREGEFDLIALGHRGKSRFEMLLGSVSHGVASHATCPVLVVR
jgi:nucleotide-binding universal stress UspA family protein